MELQTFWRATGVFAGHAPDPPVAPPEECGPREQNEPDEEPVGHGELDLAGVAFPVHSLGKEGLTGVGCGFLDPDEALPPGAAGVCPSEFDPAGDLSCGEVKARAHPKEAIKVMLRPRSGPAEEDEDEDAEPEGFPAVDWAGEHRLRRWLPDCHGEAFHSSAAADEEGAPRKEEKEDEEPVGDGSGLERVFGRFLPVDGLGQDGVAPRFQFDAGNGESRSDDSDDL